MRFSRSSSWLKTFGVIASVICPLMSPLAAHADTNPSFNNITPADYDNIVRELSANFSFSSQTGASGLGGLGGFELGLIGGITDTPEIQNIVRTKGDPSFKEKRFPHAAALARVGLPAGFTIEAAIFPKVNVSDLQLSQFGGALMWTLTDSVLLDFPVSLAVKGFYNKTKLGVKQKVTNTSGVGPPTVDGRVNFDNSMMGGQLLVSKKLSVFEPYVGIGYAKAKGELSVETDNVNYQGYIFAIPGQSGISQPSSSQLLAGLDIKLLFISIGAEYQRSFQTSSYSGRLSFRF